MKNTDNLAKQAERDRIAKAMAEFERENGPIETQPVEKSDPKGLSWRHKNAVEPK